MVETNLYTWGGWGFVGAVAAISIPIFLGSLAYYYNAVKEQLEDNQDRARIKTELEGQTTAFERYQSALLGFTEWTSRWFGKPWRLRAFDRCLLVAFVYPVALLFLAWVMGMPGIIGRVKVFDDSTIGQRLITAAFLITMSFGIFIYFKNSIPIRFAYWVTGLLFIDAAKKQKGTSRLHQFVDYTVRGIVFCIAFFVAIGFAVVVAGAAVFAVAGIAASIFAFSVASAVAFATSRFGGLGGLFYGIGAGAGLAALSLSSFLLISIGKDNNLVGAAAALVLLLPLANALLDMISWGLTRTLLSKIDHESEGVRGLALVTSALLIDFVVAVICLVGLVALISIMLEASNMFFASLSIPIFDWKSQIDLARASPFSEGLFVTGMLATTLVPSVVHLTLGIGHAMTVWSPSAQKASTLIHDSMPISAKQVVARVMLYRKLWMIPAFMLVCMIGWGLLGAFSAWIEPFGLILKKVALVCAALVAEL